ncbi:Terephthalate 1,2-dioxygenase, terminal oxygenase component subunit beta 1 [Variovorax sp. PBS-H4]|uniref:aromatic-ring-hydroxylating dioxygenase subunit beta n=1 Tax=Variovorax sp. PBS-H4 TaxID=434008 RepID=UPI0013181115|nr:aromatic-ring-hydroxylating dioxygenase subunit beta [Variovorax sp. PBS-H4]VTU36105.1 Terephthalate 1,2-dioxygenase, terminal oxygenase component subunit beta 1 [Variovorax sp. PBS-H4]
MEKLRLTPELAFRVETLLAEYVDCIDDERYAEWPAFFDDRCLYKIITRDNHRRKLPIGLMYCDNRNMLRDRITSMKSANVYEPHTYRHALSRTVLSERPDGSIGARTGYIVARIMHDGQTDLFSTGVYEDSIAEVDGRLMFKERVVVIDSTSIDALLVIPL